MKRLNSFLCSFIIVLFSVALCVFAVSAESDECNHKFKKYISDKNATCFSDGTKTALCENGCGEKSVITDKGSKIILSKPDKITAGQTTSSIKLKWSAVKGATAYQVFYKKNGKWKKLRSTKNTYTEIKNIKSGYKVRFAVRAYAKSGDKTITAKKSAYINTATKCKIPSKIISTEGKDFITLKWSAVSGADGYRVYKKTSKGWKTLTSSTKSRSVTYKKLASGKKMTFAVRAYVKTDKVIWSDYKKITTSTVTATPSLSVNFNSKGKISLSWKAVNGADGYQLYYKKGNAESKLYKSYKKARTIKLTLNSDYYYTFYLRSVKKPSDKTLYSDFNSVTVHIGKNADRIVVNPDQEKWSLLLVNNYRELPAGYKVQLASIAGGYQLDYRVAPYFNAMYEAAAREGIILSPNSAYRTNEYQQTLFQRYVQQYMYNWGMSRAEAENRVRREVMAPGTSEHNLGFAVDIGFISASFRNTAQYIWLKNNAHKYGFIERYTTEKQSVTEIIPEPWHWRFVGVEYASKIKNSGLCLEEYLEKYKLL